MEKIGILTCLHSNDVCARVGCLRAFFERRDFFKEYGPETGLGAVMTCNGCASERGYAPREDPGIREKLEKLVSENITAVHVGVCRMHGGKECPRMTEICRMAQESGIRVVRGTHRE